MQGSAFSTFKSNIMRNFNSPNPFSLFSQLSPFFRFALCVEASPDQSAPIMEMILFPIRREKKIHPLNHSKLQ